MPSRRKASSPFPIRVSIRSKPPDKVNALFPSSCAITGEQMAAKHSADKATPTKRRFCPDPPLRHGRTIMASVRCYRAKRRVHCPLGWQIIAGARQLMPRCEAQSQKQDPSPDYWQTRGGPPVILVCLARGSGGGGGMISDRNHALYANTLAFTCTKLIINHLLRKWELRCIGDEPRMGDT